MKARSTVPMRIAKTGYIIMSLFFCAVGVLLMLHPGFSVLLLGEMMGTGLLVFGAIKVVGYLSKDLFRLAFQYDLEFGLLMIVLGLILLLNPIDIMTFLFIALGIVIVSDALFKVRISREAHLFGIRQWWVVLALAVITGLIGLALIFRPVDSMLILTVLLGASLCAEGMLNICVALCTVKIIRNQYPDVIDADFKDEKDDEFFR